VTVTRTVGLLVGTLALALAGCGGGTLPGEEGAPAGIVSPAAGALVSAGNHDVLLLVHHALAETQS